MGGGKTHTLTALYHLAKAGTDASKLPGVADLLSEAGIAEAPSARVGVFVGNAWDPTEGRETPWIDLARQLAGDQGVAALGAAARTTPPGTESLAKVFAATDAPVLLLFDEVLNFVNRHRGMAESFHAFLQNLTVAVAGTTKAAAVISLPRSQVEMTDWDQQWQERITKVVRRVARDLIANDESEISEGCAGGCSRTSAMCVFARRSLRPTRTGASSVPPAFRRTVRPEVDYPLRSESGFADLPPIQRAPRRFSSWIGSKSKCVVSSAHGCLSSRRTCVYHAVTEYLETCAVDRWSSQRGEQHHPNPDTIQTPKPAIQANRLRAAHGLANGRVLCSFRSFEASSQRCVCS